MKKSFVWGQNHIFQVKIWQKKKSPVKETSVFFSGRIFVLWQNQKGPGKWHRAIWAIRLGSSHQDATFW
jgi:hypothetical protein